MTRRLGPFRAEAPFSFSPGADLTPSSIPVNEPSSFSIAETVKWQRSFGDFPPSDGYALKYYFNGASAFTASADGSSTNGTGGATWVVTLKPADTTGKTAGIYKWAAYAEKGSGATLERWLVAGGAITLTADITVAAAGALQTHEERTLALIETALEGRLTGDMQSYTIDGRQITKIPVLELRRLRVQYQAAVWRIQNGGRLGPPVKFTFGTPS